MWSKETDVFFAEIQLTDMNKPQVSNKQSLSPAKFIDIDSPQENTAFAHMEYPPLCCFLWVYVSTGELLKKDQ